MKGRLSGFLQSKFNVYLCLAMGWRWARRYLNLLGILYFLFRWKEKQRIGDSVGTVFASGNAEPTVRQLRKAILTGIVTHYYEKLFNAYCSDEDSHRFFSSRVADEGLRAVREALLQQRGVLLVTGHYGGVEFLPGYLGSQGIPVSIVVRFASEGLRQLSRQKGERFLIRIIDADREPNVFFAICRHLRQNRVVITQCDEIDEWRQPRDKTRFSFLGRRAAPDRALNLLAQRARCPVVFGVMHRDADLGYRFIARQAAEITGAGRWTIGEAGLKFVEAFVYRHPQQWYQWAKLPAVEKNAEATALPRWSATVPTLILPPARAS
ncbi:MAG: lysophospholipid acyltransferase family protein [Desulfobacterales bacterium]|jgi:lauroyl/myristoyl acyltransferase